MSPDQCSSYSSTDICSNLIISNEEGIKKQAPKLTGSVIPNFINDKIIDMIELEFCFTQRSEFTYDESGKAKREIYTLLNNNFGNKVVYHGYRPGKESTKDPFYELKFCDIKANPYRGVVSYKMVLRISPIRKIRKALYPNIDLLDFQGHDNFIPKFVDDKEGIYK